MWGTIEYPNLFQYLASLNLFKLLKSCLKIVFMENSISNATVSMDERDSNFPRKFGKSELEFGYSCQGKIIMRNGRVTDFAVFSLYNFSKQSTF